MNSFKEYLQMKEEADKAITVEEIFSFIRKYREMPLGMIKELQTKLDIINQENKLNGTGGIHIISYRSIRQN